MYAKMYGIQTKIARCFAFVGPYLPLDIHYAIGNFIRDGLNGGPIVVSGDGTPYRSYLYAADLAIGLWTILFKGKSCEPYNVGSENEISIAELAQTVAKCFEKSIEVKIAKTPQHGKPSERYMPSTKRAVLLGLTSTVNVKQSISKTIKFSQSF
jgi:dTDP-glucose 4,6-dehydratase